MQDVLSQLAAFARLVEPTLDTRSYYELLNVAQGATLTDIRTAYYKVAAQLHPDRYLNMSDQVAKEKLETIYTRITEGYRILTDPQKRKAYDQVLAKGEKRLVSNNRERKGPQNPEESLKHPEAKKFFRLGILEMGRRNWKGAVFNFNLARAYEPQAKAIEEKLEEAKARQTQTGTMPGK